MNSKILLLSFSEMEIRGKKFVVFGGAGLLGSHTVDALLAEDVAEVIIYDNFVRGTMGNLFEALKDPRVKVYNLNGDILDQDMLKDVLGGIDGVFHFAALWLLHCQEYPSAAFEVNVRGTFNVLEACIKTGVKRFVYSSSASVYGDAVTEKMTEEHPFNNKNFYGATKICGEAMLRAFHYQYGLDYVGLRYMNVYGPRQDYKGAYIAVIMKMLDCIDRGESPTIIGDGSETFDFIAVEDCARANIFAMKSNKTDSFYNVSTGIPFSLKQLAELLLELTGCDRKIIYTPQRQGHLVSNRIGCPRKAEEELGFKAKIKLRDGLLSTLKWRREHILRFK